MYGTIARMRVKPGALDQLRALSEREQQEIPGLIGQYVYRMDADPNIFYLVVVFESRESYVANAQSPEQHQRYLEMVSLLDGPPEWHHGEILFALP